MSTSTAKNPTFTYPSSGTYTVQLQVTLPSGKVGTVSRAIDVFLLGDVSFTASVNFLTVTFTDTSIAPNIIAWEWNFDDSGVSFVQNPVHTYNNAGVYHVTLTIHTLNGGIGFTGDDVTTVDEAVAAFSFDDSGDPDIVFTDESIMDNPLSWSWDFGDGIGTSTDQNPVYIYTANGTYTVTLIITTVGGSTDTITHDVTISSYITTFSHTFNFTGSNGGWTPINLNDGNGNRASYTAATGWQDGPGSSDEVTIFYNFSARQITQIDFHTTRSSTLGGAANIEADTYTAAITNNTSSASTANLHESHADSSSSLSYSYSHVFDGTSVSAIRLQIFTSPAANALTITSCTVYGIGTDPF